MGSGRDEFFTTGGAILGLFKEHLVHRLLKKKIPPLDPTYLNSCHPVYHLPFLGKVANKVVVWQVQRLLKLPHNHLSEPLPVRFWDRLWDRNGTDDLWQKHDEGRASLLALLDFSAALNIINYSMLLGQM